MTRTAERLAANALIRLRARYGMRATIAAKINRTFQDVDGWRSLIPLEHVFAVSEVCNTPPEQLRPDYFISDPLRRERTLRFIAEHRTDKALKCRGRRKPLTEKHRSIWMDRTTYRTNHDAANAIIADLGHYVSPETLRAHFGSARGA